MRLFVESYRRVNKGDFFMRKNFLIIFSITTLGLCAGWVINYIWEYKWGPTCKYEIDTVCKEHDYIKPPKYIKKILDWSFDD